MTKESIIQRLIDQGHIVMTCADRILNKKAGYIKDLEDLHRDGPISTSEAVTLLSDAYYEDARFPELSQSNESLIARHKTKLSSEMVDELGETCRNGKLWKDCTCC
jgi:hypothetical protein|tara:strand:+ start:6034 stop:6351 length:318 start_codon:yes stop_codon:yes gene_type:complete